MSRRRSRQLWPSGAEGRSPTARPGDGVALLLVVDAANVVGARPDGWWRDRPAAARRLLADLGQRELTAGEVLGAALGALSAQSPVRPVLVLEGAARAGAAPGEHGSVRVVHAAGSGDDEIVAQVRAAGTGRVGVVTSDRGLADRVGHRAVVVSPRRLWRLLDPTVGPV